MHGYLQRWKAEPTIHPLIEDDFEKIKSAVEAGLDDHDIIFINAGTSKGREDFTTAVIQEFGDVIVHGVAMHPGHPTVLGVIQGKPIIGVPGYPIATWITLDQFARPWLERYYGCALDPQHTVRGTLARRVHSPLGEIEFIRVRLEHTDTEKVIHQLQGKASALSSLINADGLLTVPEASGGYQQGDEVDVRLLK
jgi:putative molybdopterin biosynthesis protein